MEKKTKVWLMIAAFLVVIGLLMFVGVVAAYRGDFGKLSTAEYETNTYEVHEAFHDISINTDTADISFISFIASESGECRVVCYEPEDISHSVTVQSGVLTITELDDRNWYDYLGISMKTPKITVYLPEEPYGVLTIKTSTGDIEIPESLRVLRLDISTSTGSVKNYASASEFIRIKAGTGSIHVINASVDTLALSVSAGRVTVSGVTCGGDIDIRVSTGKVSITDTTCKNITSHGDTGSISLKNVLAEEKISIERDTGDVRFDGCDAGEIFVHTDTGDITGTFLTEKVFIAETDTGHVDIPKSITGGKCEVKTDTGDIKLDIS